MVVDYDGRILAQADPGPGEKVVVAEIDVGAMREARRRRLGHNPLAHLRAGAYGLGAEDAYPAGTWLKHGDLYEQRRMADQEDAIRRVIRRRFG